MNIQIPINAQAVKQILWKAALLAFDALALWGLLWVLRRFVEFPLPSIPAVIVGWIVWWWVILIQARQAVKEGLWDHYNHMAYLNLMQQALERQQAKGPPEKPQE